MSPAWLYPSLVLTYFPSSRSVCSLSTPSLLGNSFALLQMATSPVAMSFACFPYFCILPPFRRLHKYFNRCAGTINYPSNHTIYPHCLLLPSENSNDCFHFYAMGDLKSILRGIGTYCAVLDRAHFGCHWRDCQQKNPRGNNNAYHSVKHRKLVMLKLRCQQIFFRSSCGGYTKTTQYNSSVIQDFCTSTSITGYYSSPHRAEHWAAASEARQPKFRESIFHSQHPQHHSCTYSCLRCVVVYTCIMYVHYVLPEASTCAT